MTPAAMSAPPTIRYDHLYRLSDAHGLFEHAEFTVPRPEHGYCVDDVARGVVVLAREAAPSLRSSAQLDRYLAFVAAAQDSAGRLHNRFGTDHRWTDHAGVEDCWGRALWGWGTVASRVPARTSQALERFESGARQRSEWKRSMAFAALGAAEILRRRPNHPAARALLADAVELIGDVPDEPRWCWPEWRLRYANAALAEVVIAAGALLDRPDWLGRGLRMLHWLLAAETRDGRLSVTPVGGWSAGEPRPGFDQQPIEVAALADACATAYDVTGDPGWRTGVERCLAWFLGTNDVGVPLFDPVSFGGCDGLLPAGRNENQGAESTLSLLGTMQQAARLRIPFAAPLPVAPAGRAGLED